MWFNVDNGISRKPKRSQYIDFSYIGCGFCYQNNTMVFQEDTEIHTASQHSEQNLRISPSHCAIPESYIFILQQLVTAAAA